MGLSSGALSMVLVFIFEAIPSAMCLCFLLPPMLASHPSLPPFCPFQTYFGQKDAMQCVLMRRLVEDLNLLPEIVVCPTSKSAGWIDKSQHRQRKHLLTIKTHFHVLLSFPPFSPRRRRPGHEQSQRLLGRAGMSCNLFFSWGDSCILKSFVSALRAFTH